MMGANTLRRVPFVELLLAVVLPLIAVSLMSNSSYASRILLLTLIWATVGVGWDLQSGNTGLFSYGHAVYFGIGGYVPIILLTKFGVPLLVGMGVGVAVAVAAAVLVGLPTLRLTGSYFVLASMAFPYILLGLANYLGYQEITLPYVPRGGFLQLQFQSPTAYVLLAGFVLFVALVLHRYVDKSRFGLWLNAIRQDEAAAEASGVAAVRAKLLALVLSAVVTAVAGTTYVLVNYLVTAPSAFGVAVSGQAMVLPIVGGLRKRWGAAIGAVLLIPLGELLQARFGEVLPGLQFLFYGIALIATMQFMPRGIYWTLKSLLSKRGQARSTTSATGAVPAVDEPAIQGSTLEVRGISKRFGGLQAVQNVSFTVAPGEIVGLIGPNGAGKTTAFNLISGFVTPDAGQVLVDGRDFCGSSPYRLAQAGVGRTYQLPKLFPEGSVSDNISVGLAALGKKGDPAHELARSSTFVGLGDLLQKPASELNDFEIRQVELARALAGRPGILLLDEPFAGLSPGALEAYAGLLRRLRDRGMAILIVDHAIGAVSALCDRLVVMADGAPIAEGKPAHVLSLPEVISVYLGKKWGEQSARLEVRANQG